MGKKGKDSFNDVKAIYESLPLEQKLLLSPRGRFIDSPFTALRVLSPDKDGFAEAYYMKGGKDKHKAFVTVGVKPEAQGKGIGKYLLHNLIARAHASGIDELVYRLDSKNDNSRKLVQKFINQPHRVFKDSEEYVINTNDFNDPYSANLPKKFDKAFSDIVDKYKQIGYDLSDVQLKGTTRSRYESGAIAPYSVIPRKYQKTGGSWAKHLNTVFMAPGVKDEIIPYLMAHELAHAVDHKFADDKLRNKVEREAKKSGFTTPYLENLPIKENYKKELFAEWLANKVMNK